MASSRAAGKPKKDKTLVIVESPAKAKTIGKFLGKGYDVKASNGHIRDLPKSKIGIDIENDFEPQYINIRGKRRHYKRPQNRSGQGEDRVSRNRP